MNSNPPHVSFIAAVDFSHEARWLYATPSSLDLLGYEPSELVGRPALDLVHPDEYPAVKQMHYDTIKQDKAAVLLYLRMKHKDPYKGYILCAVSRTVVHDVLVGSVSLATPGPRAMRNAATAQAVDVVTPHARDFEFRRWNDPSPMPPSPIPNIKVPDSFEAATAASYLSTSPPSTSALTAAMFRELAPQSLRTALILDRFSLSCGIMYCSNDILLSSSIATGRSFFDFVVQRDEILVRSWIDVVKGWGVNEKGQPSDGGFGFGKFTLLPDGRQSNPEWPPGRARSSSSLSLTSNSSQRSSTHVRERSDNGEMIVDAIFSAHSDGLMVILRKASQ